MYIFLKVGLILIMVLYTWLCFFFSRWYHGCLDRQTAETRLQQQNKTGSYLIRESERKPGSYVLSYLEIKDSTISGTEDLILTMSY